MSVIDDLQILVTADASGVENVLKRTTQTVMGTVNAINAQEIDWTSIFTASVSPALIGGVASVFAFAISNAIQFQTGMAQAGTAAGETATGIAAIGQAALETSTTVPTSAQEIADAMLQLSAIFPNVNDQQQIAAAMAELTASGFGDLSEIVKTVIDIFKNFGVTTTEQATDVLTELMHSAETAKESIPALARQFLQFTPQLIESGIKLKDLNLLLAGFAGQVKVVGSANASAVFNALATAVSGANPALTALFGGVDNIRKSLVDNGGLTAVQKLSTTFSTQFGDNVALIAKNFGLSDQAIAGVILDGKNIPALNKSILDTATNTQTIKGAFDQADVGLNKFMEDWNTLKVTLMPLGDFLMKGLTASIESATFAIKTFESQFVNPPGFTTKFTPSTTADSTVVSLLGVIAANTAPLANQSSSPTKPAINWTWSGFDKSTSSQMSTLYNMFQGTSH